MDTLTLARSFASLLLDTAAKGTALLLLAVLAGWLCRRSSAALRHSIWCMTMGGLLLLPVAAWALPAWQIPILPPEPAVAPAPAVAEVVRLSPPSPESATPPRGQTIPRFPAERSVMPSVQRPIEPVVSDPPVVETAHTPLPAIVEPAVPRLTAIEWTSLLVSTLWSLGVALFGVLLLVGLWRTVQLRRASLTVREGEWPVMLVELRQRLGLSRSVELREHAQSVVPLTWGIWRPVVLLPKLAREWGEPMRRAVLLHELAHVQRGDVACQVLGRLTCVLYWFHPLAWFALRQLRQEREQACDDAVVQSGEKASDYAEQLLQVARLCCAPRGLSLGVAMAEGSSIERRILSLFDSARSHGPLTRRVAIASLLIGGAILAGLAPIEPTASQAEPAANQASSLNESLKADPNPASNETNAKATEGEYPFSLDLCRKAFSDPATLQQLEQLKPVYGKAKRGIQLGLAINTLSRSFAKGERFPLMLVYRNTGQEELTFHISQDHWNDPPTVTDKDGHHIQVSFVMHWMFVSPLKITLKPGEAWCEMTPGLYLGEPMPSIKPVAGKYRLTHPQGIWDVNTTPQLRTDIPALPTTIPDTSLPNEKSPKEDEPASSVPAAQIVETPTWSESLTTGTIEFEIAPSQAGTLEARILASLLADDSSVAKTPTQELASPPVLQPATADQSIEGIVLDAVTRQPISGAVVDFGYFGPKKNIATTTDKGQFQIQGVDPLEMLIAVVTKDGYAQRMIECRGREFGRVILLDNQTYFEGTITDAAGKPAAEANVQASWEVEFSDGSVATLNTETRSKADGTYRLHVESLTKNSTRTIETTGYDIQVSAPGRGVARSSGHFIGRGPQELPLKLEPGVRFEAKVVDSETGAAVPGYVLYTMEKPYLMARSDAEGRLVLEDLSPGVMTFMTGEGEGKEVPDCTACKGIKTYENVQYSRWWSPDVRSDEEGPWGQLDVPEGDEFQDNFNPIYFDMQLGMAPATIFVEKSATIFGLVTDPAGKPVEGATVAPAHNGGSISGDTRFSVKTDKDGRYVMHIPASKNTQYNVLAHDGDYETWRNWANGVADPLQTTPGQTIENVDLQLTRPGSAKGRVLRKGKPVANYIVRTVACDGREHSYYHPAVKTNADGTFEIKFVRPGKHFLQVGYFQYSRKGDQGPVIEVVAGETIADQELEAKQQPDPEEGVVPEPTPAVEAPAVPQKEPTPVGQNDKAPKAGEVKPLGKVIVLPNGNGESTTAITGDVEITLDLDKAVWWGEAVEGLEPGFWLTESEDPRHLRVPMDSLVKYRVVVRNTTDKEIEFLVRLLPFDGMDVPYLIPSSQLDVKGKIVASQPAKEYHAQGAANVLDGINASYIITLAAGESVLVPGEWRLYVGKTDDIYIPRISDFVPGTHWIVQPLLVHPLADKERAELDRQLSEVKVTKIDRSGKTRQEPVVLVEAPDNSMGKFAYAKYHLEVGTLDASADRNVKSAIWGEVEKGMQCGIRILNPQPSYQTGDTLEAELLWRNTSKAVITTTRPRQLDLYSSIKDAEGDSRQIDFGARYDLLPGGHDFQPGEVRSLGVTKVTLVAQGTLGPKDNKEPGHITLEPGKYKLSASGGVGNISPPSGKYEFTVVEPEAPQPPVAPPNTISGQIVNDKQEGIAGADVALVAFDIVQGQLERQGHVIATTIADPLGNYSLKLPAEEADRKKFGAVWAKAEGHVAARSNWSTVIAALPERKAVLTLAATKGTHMRVLDSTGKPLPGAKLVPVLVGVPQGVGYPLPKEWEEQSTGTSDAEGKAHLPHVDAEAIKGLDIVPSGDMGMLRYGQNHFLNIRPQKEGDQHFEFQMPETGSVTGQLVVSPGSTLPKDLKITLESYIKPHSLSQAVITVPVDADGKFHVDKLAVGWLFVPAFLPADQPLRADVAGRIEVKANEELQLRIPVALGVRIHGQVRKSDTQEGVPNYSVSVIYGQAVSNLNPGFAWLKHEMETDADGRFECLVPPGPINVNTSRYVDGYSSAFSWLPDERRGHWGGMRFVVPAEESFDLGILELTRSVDIQGQVVNLKNEPLVDWSVYGYPNIPGFTQSGTMNSMAGVHSDKAGNFSGSYRQTYPPAYWKVSQRVWKTKYEFDDHKYAAKVISRKPLVLQVDTTQELSGDEDESIPIDPEVPVSPATPTKSETTQPAPKRDPPAVKEKPVEQPLPTTSVSDPANTTPESKSADDPQAADANPAFTEFVVNIQPFEAPRNGYVEQLKFGADGKCWYKVEGREAEQNLPARDGAVFDHTLSPERVRKLNQLLSDTQWLTEAAVAKGQAPPLHATAYRLTLKREGQEKSIACTERGAELYKPLLHFLDGIAVQERVVYLHDYLSGEEGTEAWLEVGHELAALRGEPYGKSPYDIDYARYLPIAVRIVRDHHGKPDEELVTAIRLIGYLKAQAELEFIHRMAQDRSSHVRQEVAWALGRIHSEESLPVLLGMMSGAGTRWEVGFELIQWGDDAVPGIVKLIELSTKDGSDERERVTGEDMIRAYLQNWDQLAQPVHPDVIAAVKQARAAKNPQNGGIRTTYHEEFLKKVAQSAE